MSYGTDIEQPKFLVIRTNIETNKDPNKSLDNIAASSMCYESKSDNIVTRRESLG